jgi:hypothetical protein
MKRVGMVLIVAIVLGAISGLGVALGQASSTPSASVVPNHGSPRTRFTVSFVAPASRGQSRDRFEVTASTRVASGCTSRGFASAPAESGERRVHVMLLPSGARHWCPGTYRGTVQEVIGPSCPPRELCPDFLTVVTIDRFRFVVRARRRRRGVAS